jgi:adenylate cyclase
MVTGPEATMVTVPEANDATEIPPNRESEVLDFVLGGSAEYTRRDLIEQSGVEEEQAAALWQAMGFPQADEDAKAFTASDLRALQVAKELQESGLIDERLMLILARAMGQSIARLADAHVAAYVDYVSEQNDGSGQNDADQNDNADQNDDADQNDAGENSGAGTAPVSGTNGTAPLVDQIEWFLPRLDELVTFVWRRQLASSLEQLLPHAADEEKPVSVGFVDLAGFTKLSRQLSRLELAQLTETFELTASGVVADLGGRLVKTIGDEIMYVAFDASCAVEIALTLIERLRDIDDIPPVHAGVATGSVLLRLGDVYGSTVNIAARLTGLARPDTLLVDKATAETLSDVAAYSVKQTRHRRVSGYRHLLPFSVRRDEGHDQD